jgi:hypothetical protein
MRNQRFVIGLLTVGVLLAWAAPAHGQFGGLQRFLFRGAEFAMDRDFISSPQRGPLFDNNLFQHRVEYNRTGDGYTYEFFRFFGPDSYDNANTLDLGPLKVQLGRDPAVVQSPQPIGVHNRVGYTSRFIPELFFSSQTGQRNFDLFSGQTNFVPVPVNYVVSLDTGVQNFEWTGNALINSDVKIHAMGFYDFELQFVNVGNQTADGILIHDEQVTDFDTGPINLSGNLFMDAIASLLQTNGSTTAAVPPRIASGASGRGKTADELLVDIEAGRPLTEEELSFLVQQMFVTAFRNDPIGFLINGMPETVPGFESLSLALQDTSDPAAIQAAAQLQQGQSQPTPITPEPGVLLLLLVTGAGAQLLRSWRLRFTPAA